MKEFQELKLKNVDTLNENELELIKKIRKDIPKPDENTLMQKVIPIGDLKNYLNGDYKTIGGYVAEAGDTLNVTKTYSETVESLRLDYLDGSGNRVYPDGGTEYCVVRFKANKGVWDNVTIPYGEKLGGVNTDGEPCTLNGFLGGRNGTIIPEWKMQGYIEPDKGAEIFKVVNGVEELVAIFNGSSFTPMN